MANVVIVLRSDNMGFEKVNAKGVKYFLHSHVGKHGNTLYFFSKKPEDGIDLPNGFDVIENPRTGLPMLKKKK